MQMCPMTWLWFRTSVLTLEKFTECLIKEIAGCAEVLMS